LSCEACPWPAPPKHRSSAGQRLTGPPNRTFLAPMRAVTASVPILRIFPPARPIKRAGFWPLHQPHTTTQHNSSTAPPQPSDTVQHYVTRDRSTHLSSAEPYGQHGAHAGSTVLHASALISARVEPRCRPRETPVRVCGHKVWLGVTVHRRVAAPNGNGAAQLGI
jgi:hypothetical protein